MHTIKNIIFDLGGVLLNINYTLTRTAFEKLGVKNFDEMYTQAEADELFKKLEKGTISVPDFYEQLNNCTGLHLSKQETNQAWNSMLLDFCEESLEFLEKLKPHYRLFLLSNTNAIHMDAFYKIYDSPKRDKKFEDYFEKCFYSFEMGSRKPDVECYQQVINELNIDPSETLFIDDLKQNIDGASAAGLHTLHLEKGMLIETSDLKKLIS